MGDKNTRFFHQKVQIHNAKNIIISLTNDQGDLITNYDQVKKCAINFYESLFWESNQFTEAKLEKLQEVVTKNISLDHQQLLIKEVSSEEIKKLHSVCRLIRLSVQMDS
ncbi:hypothetical protein ACH5RR_026824 [Cinchona calisaya]|uniref:Uncharacterized protein n=1 Tax=Cinchona calisaya TaxID=153742 RepID=A0ABD2Z3P4_9GENT